MPKHRRKTTPPRLDVNQFRGEWVALDPKTRQVIGHAASLRDAERAAVERGVSKPLMLAVPESDAYFVGLN